MNTTAYALIALSGETLPVGIIEVEEEITDDGLVEYQIEGSVGTVCTGEIETVNVLTLVEDAAEECGYAYNIDQTDFGPYLTRIGDDEAGGSIGWLYYVDQEAGQVGAADYALTGGESVLWWYGDWNSFPEDFFDEEEVDESLESVSVNLSVIIDSGDDQASDTIAFTVDTSSLDFGTLEPGSTGAGEVVIENEGDVAIDVEAKVEGDDLFKNYLLLDALPWGEFMTGLGIDESDRVNVSLPVPNSYADNGVKDGTLIFWATAQ